MNSLLNSIKRIQMFIIRRRHLYAGIFQTMVDDQKNPDAQARLDSDFTPEEHAEFEKLEAEKPYREIKEETIRVPRRPERINDTKNDTKFLLIFCIIATLVLAFVIFMAVNGFGP